MAWAITGVVATLSNRVYVGKIKLMKFDLYQVKVDKREFELG